MWTITVSKFAGANLASCISVPRVLACLRNSSQECAPCWSTLSRFCVLCLDTPPLSSGVSVLLAAAGVASSSFHVLFLLILLMPGCVVTWPGGEVERPPESSTYLARQKPPPTPHPVSKMEEVSTRQWAASSGLEGSGESGNSRFFYNIDLKGPLPSFRFPFLPNQDPGLGVGGLMCLKCQTPWSSYAPDLTPAFSALWV